VTNAASGVTKYTYDQNDNKIGETDANNNTTSYGYDALNRLHQITDPLNNVTIYGYDVDGNRTSVTDGNGKTTNFTYDALNRLTSTIDPLLETTTYVYDLVGNKIRVLDANSNLTQYAYDQVNRLTQVTDALNGVVKYAYDPAGNKFSATDADNHTTTYSYDKLNRLSSTSDPLGNTVKYGYDVVGNHNSTTNARGQLITFSYDPLMRLTGISYPDGSAVGYTYDADGNRTQMVDSTGTTSYLYDALNRVTKIVNPTGNIVSYGYDAVGNRTGVTYPDGSVVASTFDPDNRLATVTDAASRQTIFGYDNVGNLKLQTNPNNTTTSRSYDAANRLIGLITTSSISGTVVSYSYTLDKVGNRTQVVDTEGITTYTYDNLYRLTNVTYPDATFAAYQYDPTGNRKVLTTNQGVTSYSYDAADRLTSAGSLGFTWDADGNMLTKGGASYTYDSSNRLTGVISGTLSVGYAYDGDSRRANKTVNGTSTQFTYDTIAGLANVLTEATSSVTTTYTYGNDLLTQTTPDGTVSFYDVDALGSVRALTSANGQITAQYDYDVFGEIKSSSGISSSEFQFAGQQDDSETGLIYLRARYYDPSVGRFTSRDPVPGFDSDPQTLNRYVYARNSPTNYTDASGKFAPLIAAFLIGAVIGGTVEGVNYYIDHGGHIDNGWDFAEHVGVGALAGGIGGVTGAWIGGALAAGAIEIGTDEAIATVTAETLSGAAGSATEQVVKNGLYGRPLTDGVLNHAMYGAIGGFGAAKFLPDLAGDAAATLVAKQTTRQVLSGLLSIGTEDLDAYQTGAKSQVRETPTELVDSIVTVPFLTSTVSGVSLAGSGVAPGQSASHYLSLMDELAKYGYNSAHPVAPPSKTK
jgi:RHS repeat-associated protein